jgi:hypothetical protein
VTARCREIQAQAAGLASLPTEDPERRAAQAHARSCADCSAALAEGAALLSLIDEALPLEAPRTETLARARQEILGDLSASREADVAGETRRIRRPASPLGIAAVTAVLAASWLLAMARHLGQGPLTVGSAAWALAAALASAAALTWGGGLLATLPLMSIGLALVGGGEGALQVVTGLKCAALELALAVSPLILTVVLARRGVLDRPVATVAAAAGAGALVGQAALHAACQAVPGTAHTLVFHFLPVPLAMLLGAWAGRGLVARNPG